MKQARREFIKKAGLVTGTLAVSSLLPSHILADNKKKFDFKISLAQWSLHKAFFNKTIDPLDFPVVAKNQFGIEAVEYVNQFFIDKAKDKSFLSALKQRCDDHGVKSLLIMVDLEGELSGNDIPKRKQAVENHYKWIEAAQFLGCHSIRVNLHGGENVEDWKKSSIESLHSLTEFAANMNINILAENHGSFSSNAEWLSSVIKQVNNKKCGVLADIANFCVRREKGDLWESPCVDWYDRYKGIKELMPYAKGVSAKTFDFDSKGNETTTDLRKTLKIVKDAGFQGYIGVEYEGNNMPEAEGVKATKLLLEKIRTELS